MLERNADGYFWVARAWPRAEMLAPGRRARIPPGASTSLSRRAESDSACAGHPTLRDPMRMGASNHADSAPPFRERRRVRVCGRIPDSHGHAVVLRRRLAPFSRKSPARVTPDSSPTARPRLERRDLRRCRGVRQSCACYERRIKTVHRKMTPMRRHLRLRASI